MFCFVYYVWYYTRCIIHPNLSKIKPESFNFVRNNFKIFILAMQNEQNPPDLPFAANSGNLSNIISILNCYLLAS